jgi:catechol 2,3-dioxygenase-like lactoylglutathione lyase family enzyme
MGEDNRTMITGLAHTGVCVPDCEAAVAYYRGVLGFRVLSPTYVMDGDAIRALTWASY